MVEKYDKLKNVFVTRFIVFGLHRTKVIFTDKRKGTLKILN